MKFMKVGSKSDQFQSEGDNIRYVAAELATDMVVSIGDVKFYVHKFPLLSKSSRLQKLVVASEDDSDEINIDDIPGGPAAFEICAKFCYGMAVTLNAYNVVAARCAAEYLEMYETVDKGNFVYKIVIFLTSSIFRSWKDSITVLQTAKSFLPWSEELKVISHCIDSIATHVSTDLSRVDWPYTYNRKKLPSENRDDPHWSSVRKQQIVPKDWWVEDLCDLPIDLYKKVITTIKAKGRLSADVIGKALKAFAARRLPSIRKGTVQNGCPKYSRVVDIIIHLLPTEKGSVSCSFLLSLLLASIVFECGEMGRKELVCKIAQQLEEATVADFLIHSPTGETTTYEIDVVHNVVEQYVMRERCAQIGCPNDLEFQDMYQVFDWDASKTKVARLVDGYLAEAARDPSLPLPKFIALAEMASTFPRSSHDGIYRAIDTFLKEHPMLTKSEKKRICRLMDCRRLSTDACAHVVRNERLPLRTVVQVLFFDQAQTAAAGATGSIKGSCRSSRSATATTNSDDDWDSNQTSEELKGELPCLRRINKGGAGANDAKSGTPKRVKKMLLRLWSNGSSSDMSETPGSVVNLAIRMAPAQIQKKVVVTK